MSPTHFYNIHKGQQSWENNSSWFDPGEPEKEEKPVFFACYNVFLFDCKAYWSTVIVAYVNKTDVTAATRETPTDAMVIGCPVCLEIQTACGFCIDLRWEQQGCYTIWAQFPVILCHHERRDKDTGRSPRRLEFRFCLKPSITGHFLKRSTLSLCMNITKRHRCSS